MTAHYDARRGAAGSHRAVRERRCRERRGARRRRPFQRPSAIARSRGARPSRGRCWRRFDPCSALDSLVLRHALRVAIVTAVAVWLAGALHLPRGYWVTITAVIILQPYTGATTLKAVQRVIGTVARRHSHRGARRAVPRHPGDSRAVVHLRGRERRAAADQLHGVLGLSHADVRPAGGGERGRLAPGDACACINTLLGGALALLGARLLWPAPEWKRLPTYMAAALRANRDYLRTVVRIFADRSDAAGRRDARASA